LVAVFSIERQPASGASPVSVKEAREKCYRTSNQAIRYDGAGYRHDQQLADVELPQNEELVDRVEYTCHGEDPAYVLHS
jgi:hypothetical protein